MKVGIAGVGRMGAAIGERLMSVGHQLVVWNRNPEKAKPLVAKGVPRSVVKFEVPWGIDQRGRWFR